MSPPVSVRALQALLDGLLRDQVFTGCAAVLWTPARRVDAASGAGAGAFFDLASLTKPLLATLALELHRRGELDLDTEVFPDRLRGSGNGGPAPSLDALLRHEGGAVPWWPLYHGRALEEGGPLAEHLWDRTGPVYSDIGYLAAARWIEERTGSGLAVTMVPRLTETIPGLDGGLEVAPCDPGRAVPCVMGTGREVVLAAELGLEVSDLGPPRTGDPQDGNARTLAEGGVLAGHAGLHGTTEAVLALGRFWLEVRRGARSGWDELGRRALRRPGHRPVGWAAEGPLALALGPDAFGHTGFTGGSLYIDPARELVAVLLGHRIDPLAEIAPTRLAFHRLARRLVDGGPPGAR